MDEESIQRINRQVENLEIYKIPGGREGLKFVDILTEPEKSEEGVQRKDGSVFLQALKLRMSWVRGFKKHAKTGMEFMLYDEELRRLRFLKQHWSIFSNPDWRAWLEKVGQEPRETDIDRNS